MLTMCGCCGMGMLLVGILGDKLSGCVECKGMCISLYVYARGVIMQFVDIGPGLGSTSPCWRISAVLFQV